MSSFAFSFAPTPCEERRHQGRDITADLRLDMARDYLQVGPQTLVRLSRQPLGKKPPDVALAAA